MGLDPEAQFLGNFSLFILDLRVAEFDNAVTLEANQMVVMIPTIKFENGFARLEVLFLQKPGLFELR